MRVKDLKAILEQVPDDTFIIVSPYKDIKEQKDIADVLSNVGDIQSVFGFQIDGPGKALIIQYSEHYNAISLNEEQQATPASE